MIKYLEIILSGKVQGVGFRFSSYEKFVELGLTGTAANTTGGTVTVKVSGEEEALKQFLRWAKQGPMGAKVDTMDYKVVQPDTEEKDVNA